MPDLVLGPLLRYVGQSEAVIWVETDRPCEVEVLGTRDRTFCVCGHHYALVCCGGLDPGSWHEYEVHLDGERAWPQDDGFPPSSFHTYPKDAPRRGQGARGARARLRRIPPAVPRELERCPDSLAPIHRLNGDDLRRPRRPRRLEHLPGLARRDAPTRVVESPHPGGACVLLDLPAPRQPRPRGPQRRRAP